MLRTLTAGEVSAQATTLETFASVSAEQGDTGDDVGRIPLVAETGVKSAERIRDAPIGG